MSMTTVSVLGSTGSIGTQTLDVIERVPDHFEVIALGAQVCSETLLEQIRNVRPSVVSVASLAKKAWPRAQRWPTSPSMQWWALPASPLRWRH